MSVSQCNILFPYLNVCVRNFFLLHLMNVKFMNMDCSTRMSLIECVYQHISNSMIDVIFDCKSPDCMTSY